MRAFLAFFIALACLLATGPNDEALAKPRRGSGQVSAGGDDIQIPLPKNLTSDRDYLDDGAARDMRPNAQDNDRYFLEQEDFAEQDPTRYSEWGSVMDQFQPY
jgi:hypothetical protein